jgi:hypothetical protein
MAYSMIPSGAPNTTWGGGALGGIAQTGIAAFQGFQNAQKFGEWWRQLQNQRLMDQFAIPAQAAGLQAGFQENALSAQLNRQKMEALMAALKMRTNNQGMMPQDAAPLPTGSTNMSGASSGEGGGLNLKKAYSAFGVQ